MMALLMALLVVMSGQLFAAEIDQQFEALSNEYLDGYFAFHPTSAVQLGFHEYDGRLQDYRQASLDREHARLKSFDQRLAEFPTDKLSSSLRIDHQILRAAIKEELFRFDGSESFTRNPMTYSRAFKPSVYLTRSWAPLETRLKSIIAIERQTPQLFAAARANLKPPLPRAFVETAIKVTQGAASFLEKDMRHAVKDVTNKLLLAEFEEANRLAIRELRDYVKWLETEQLPHAQVRFALGRDKFMRLVQEQELVDATPEEILQIGMRELKREQEVFRDAGKVIDPNKPVMEVFTAIQNDHPTAANLIPDIAKNTESIRQFVLDRRICSIPSEVRAIVTETPAYSRATSFASMDSPGPFEKVGHEAFYYVTPVDAEWTAAQQKEWLTAFNYYTSDVLSIHEAYPGHYVQHLHLNSSAASRLRKIFGSYAFVEGWAHYTEQMILDEGFSAADKIQAAKYRMAQADESLLRYCRLCCSIQMHCGDMTIDEATKFFQDNCYYAEQPARQEATRGSFDPGYLNYSLGKLMIFKLREDWRKQEGDKFSMQRFHDTFLGHGMPQIPLLRQIMLKDKSQWKAAL
jgi:uncharacterized protein (DUF885 family)